MEVVRIRQLFRILFFVGAIVMFLGIAAYMMWSQLGGVLLLIAGMVIAVIALSVTKFFATYDMHHWLDRKKPPMEE